MVPHSNRRLIEMVGRLFCGVVVVGCLPLVGSGCSSPSGANITLRKQNAELQGEIEQLKKQREADLATIQGLKDRTGVLPTLPEERLDRLVTVGSIKLTKLTGGYDESNKGGVDTGVRAYVRQFDTTGDLMKAAGTFTVEVFDLADKERPVVGKQVFPVEKADDYWSGMSLVYSFVLPVPWLEGKPPKHDELTVKVTYTDELTQRVFAGQSVVRVKLGAEAAAGVQATPARSGT